MVEKDQRAAFPRGRLRFSQRQPRTRQRLYLSAPSASCPVCVCTRQKQTVSLLSSRKDFRKCSVVRAFLSWQYVDVKRVEYVRYHAGRRKSNAVRVGAV